MAIQVRSTGEMPKLEIDLGVTSIWEVAKAIKLDKMCQMLQRNQGDKDYENKRLDLTDHQVASSDHCESSYSRMMWGRGEGCGT